MLATPSCCISQGGGGAGGRLAGAAYWRSRRQSRRRFRPGRARANAARGLPEGRPQRRPKQGPQDAAATHKGRMSSWSLSSAGINASAFLLADMATHGEPALAPGMPSAQPGRDTASLPPHCACAPKSVPPAARKRRAAGNRNGNVPL